ncbi:Fanconi anemia group B protein [Discoglossus pictus]
MKDIMFLDDKHEKVLAYNGDVITFRISLPTKGACGATERPTVYFFRRTFQETSGLFVENSTGHHSFSTSHSCIELVCVNCVADSRTGIIVPCVLLSQSKKKKTGLSKCTLLMLHGSNELECILTFKLDIEAVDNLQICDGPVVLWRHHEKLQYVTPQTTGIVTAPVNISSINWVDEIKGEGIIILGTGTISEHGDGLNTLNLDLHQVKEFVVYSIGKQNTIPGSCFLPNAYSSVICCLQVCEMRIENDKYETSVVAASSEHLIWFCNGVPKEVCRLPFENPFKLQVASTSHGDLLFIVSFTSGDVCTIWKDSWQIAATWHQVRSVLVDDFIGTGSDQMLLLFKEDPSKSNDQQHFQITDCGEINFPNNFSSCKDGELSEDGFKENRFLTIQALEARLQAGLLSVQEMQQHLQVKDTVLNSSCEALIDMVQGNAATVRSEEEECLVSLWDDLDSSTYPSKTETCSSPVDPESFVEKVWHHIVDDVLVVGVKINQDVYLSLSNIGLSLIMDQEISSVSPVTKCQTNVLKLAINSFPVPSAAYQTEPMAKKLRLDVHGKDNLSGDYTGGPSSQNDLEHTVTAVTELSPLLALNSTSCVLLLHARRKNQPDCFRKSERLTVPCGRISLNLEDVLKGKHTVNVFEHCQGGGSLEGVFALLSAYKKSYFHIHSPSYTLTSVRAWLLGHMHGEPVKEIPEIIISNRAGSLQGTLFIWTPNTPCEGTLTIFYRNRTVLLQCLYSLKSVLPPTCVVNTLRLGGNNCLTEELAKSMEEELLALRGSVSTAACEIEKDLTLSCNVKKKSSNTIGSFSDTKEHIQKYREELETEQKQSKLGSHLTTHSNLYRQNALNVAQIQMDTDLIACKLAQL